MAVRLPVFMDSHSTTPVDPRVLEAMLPYFAERFGHPGSRNHAFGWEAEAAVERAREQLARLIGVRDSKEIVYTSGGTEAVNLAIKGVIGVNRGGGDHIVTTVIESRAVLDPCRRLEREGAARVTYLPVDATGLLDPDLVRQAITPRTVLVSVMLANNEIGTIQPVAEVGRITRASGVLFHVDATEAVGKIPVDVERMGIDLLSCTAHKLYGPKGIGALYVRRRNPRVRLAAQIDGGGHERGLRSGTVPVPLAVGFGRAAEICGEVMAAESARLAVLRDRLQARILAAVDEVYLNGHPERRLPHTLNVSFAHVEGESVLMSLSKELALSSGSACTSATLEPSYVIQALGRGAELAHASVRYGLHRFTTDEEIDFAAERTIEVVRRLRELSPVYEAARSGAAIGRSEPR
ncbi:MAG TPA: IscS subfamily cysteine desulfurase [Actinomycetota bacterium]|jgi:cysteine desulfurase|nr:IscS subfamily cysteine desulfurase [Actinomycetota bacterium]